MFFWLLKNRKWFLPDSLLDIYMLDIYREMKSCQYVYHVRSYIQSGTYCWNVTASRKSETSITEWKISELFENLKPDNILSKRLDFIIKYKHFFFYTISVLHKQKNSFNHSWQTKFLLYYTYEKLSFNHTCWIIKCLQHNLAPNDPQGAVTHQVWCYSLHSVLDHLIFIYFF